MSGDPPRPRERRVVALADLAAIGALASLPVLLDCARGRIHAGFDLGLFQIPFAEWWWSRPRFSGGWNPWVFGGYPANADPQLPAHHPFDLLALLLPAPTALAVEAALAPALAGAGMWLHLRGLGACRAARRVGALAFSLGGFVAGHGMHPGLLRAAMLLPWLFLAIDACSGRRLVAALAAGTAAILASGHPQASLYALALVALYAVARGRPLRERRAWLLLGGFAAGVGLAAPVWLPFAELAPRTTRALAAPTWPDLRMDAEDAPQLLVPLAGPGSAASPLAALMRCGTLECAAYPGTAVWLLLASLLPALLRDRRARYWLAVGAAGLVGASGALGLATGLPGLRGPSRLLLWWSAAASVLGGLALAAWPADAARAPLRRWWAAAAAVAALLAGYAVWHPADRRAVIGPAVALALAAPAALAWRSPRRLRAFVVAALAVDLVAFRLSLPGVGVAPEVLARARGTFVPVAQALAAIPGTGLDRALYLPPTMARNHAIGAGVRTVQGYNPLVLREVAELLGMPPGLEAAGLQVDPGLAAPSSHALDLLRVRLVTLPTAGPGSEWLDGAPPGRFERLGPAGADGLVHYRNPRSAPLAWLVPRLRRVDPGRAIAILRDDRGAGGFDPAREALVEDAGPGDPRDAGCWAAGPRVPEVDVLGYQDDRILLAATAPCAAVLVTSELAYPGWRASVDGRPAALGVVNGAFRGMVVPAGEHRVELRYAPVLPWIGRLAAALTLALLLGAAALVPRRRGASGTRHPRA